MTAKESIASGLAAFCEAFNAGDAAGVAAQYTSHTEIFPPGSTRIAGRPAVQNFWPGIIDASPLLIDTRNVTSGRDDAHIVRL